MAVALAEWKQRMFDPKDLLTFLGLVVVCAPLLLTALLGLSSLVGWKLSERTITESVQVAILSGLVAAVAVLALMLLTNTRHVPIPESEEFGQWVILRGDGSAESEIEYQFSVKFVFDRLSVPFAILSFVLTGAIGAFASRYMHRERGFNRFFVLYAVFLLGMIVTSLAGTIETLFAGWELVGLSSALLVAFFRERPAPSRNGLWVWIVYRISDAAFLLAAVVMQNVVGHGDFDKLLGGTATATAGWPEHDASIHAGAALIVGLLLLFAAAGKSALVPFSGWLPRAMEGPTPSSAVFYGALSVHLGAFLLLRVSPLLDASFWLSAIVVALGLTTALYAYLAGSVQTDIKSALSFASLLQVGIIVAEIGVGLRYIPLIHIMGHACLRTLQFLRAPTLLHDYHRLENAIGEHLPAATSVWDRFGTERFRSWLYRLGLERGYLDALLTDYIVAPFVWLLGRCDTLERRWTDFLSGGSSRESEVARPTAESFDDLA
jgi:NAD(P)H-quinone oxidoreductase subunit 5